MNTAAKELSDWKTAHQDLADDLAKYRSNAGIEPATTVAPPPPQAAKPRRPRKNAP